MALVEVVYGYGLRALAGAARVGKVYFRPHGAGVTIGVFQRIPAAFAKHARQIFRSTRAGKKWMAAIQKRRARKTQGGLLVAPRGKGDERTSLPTSALAAA
jgi:hypothetical protein